MTPARWQHIKKLLGEALDRPAGHRAAFLAEHCPDEGLRAEVEALLAFEAELPEVLNATPGDLALFVEPEALEEDGPASGTSSSNSVDPYLGRTISHYEVMERLGGGGMGVVYRAYDTRLDRSVALKFLPPHLSANEEAKRRFVREAKAASALDHLNICAVYEIGETAEGQLFIAMAYYEGETLKAKIARGPLPVEKALDYAVQIAEGLAKSHEQGIVHRDVKPANVMVTGTGEVKLVDFGVAKLGDATLTQIGQALGTAAYMSPEQAHGEAVDERTDLWSLGALLYEMLTGERPFNGAYPQAVIYSILNEDPEPLGDLRSEVPEALEEVVSTLLQKDPCDRHSSAEDLLADLRLLRDGAWPPPRRWRRIFGSELKRRAAGTVGLAVLLALVGTLTWQSFSGVGVGPRLGEPAVSTEGIVRSVSVAVLPLENRSGDPDQEYFADGMTDAIIANLTRIEALRVIAPTSVMRYKDADADLPKIAEELGVEYIVIGAVFSPIDNVRVTASLVEAASGRTLWTKSFARGMRDVLALQWEVARAVAEGVEVKIPQETEARLAEAPEVNPEAYRYYQKGVQVRKEQKAFTSSWGVAREYFKRAVAVDSSFAPAWAWLAQMRVLLDSENKDAENEAEEAVEKALHLDPDLVEAHVALAMIRAGFNWDGTGAEAAFRRAIALDPGNQQAHYEYGWLLMRLGRTKEAVARMKRALSLDPLSMQTYHGLVEAYRYDRQYEKAIEQARRALEIERSHPLLTYNLAGAYLAAGRYDEAEAAYRRLEASHGWAGWVYWSSHGAALVHAGREQREEALAWIESRKAWMKNLPAGAVARTLIQIAQVYSVLGEIDWALDALEEAHKVLPHAHGFVYLEIDANYDPLRGEPRFQALLEKVGFA